MRRTRMNYCNECIHEYSPIKLEPCRSCVLTNAHPSFEAKPPKIITNREWLNGLSNQQYAEAFFKIQKIINGYTDSYIGLIQWLEQEHTT